MGNKYATLPSDEVRRVMIRERDAGEEVLPMQEIYECNKLFQSKADAEKNGENFIKSLKTEEYETASVVVDYDPRTMGYKVFVRVIRPEPQFIKATAKADQIHGFIERCIQKAVDEGLIDLSGQGRDKYGK